MIQSYSGSVFVEILMRSMVSTMSTLLGLWSEPLLCISQGWAIQLHLVQAQRNVEAFEADATEFKPERFLDAHNKPNRWS